MQTVWKSSMFASLAASILLVLGVKTAGYFVPKFNKLYTYKPQGEPRRLPKQWHAE